MAVRENVVVGADGGDITVGRRSATFVYGRFDVVLPEGVDQVESDTRIQDGFVYRPSEDIAPFDIGFVRADATIDLELQTSDLELVVDGAQKLVDGDVFFERDIPQAGLGEFRPGVDFHTGDIISVELWSKRMLLPVTADDWVASRELGPDGKRVHVSGQLISDPEGLQRHNLERQRQVAADKRTLERQVSRAAAAAAGAQSAAEGAQATADGAAVDVVPFFAMVEQGTVPTAPTTDPPPAGWSTEEPGWLEGHNLWRSELTTRGDGTFEWSAPSQVRSWTLAGEARGLAEDAALTAVMVNSPQESVVPVRSDGWPFWATGGSKTAEIGPSGESVYRGTFVSSSAPDAFFRLTDVVDFKLVWWMRADAPATVSFRLVDTEGVDRVQAVRMWSPDTGEWVNTTSVSVPTPDAWTEYSAVVRVTPGTEDVRLVAGGAVLLSDVRLGVFSVMQEEINQSNDARLAELDTAREENEKLNRDLLDLSEDLRKRPIPVMQTGGDPTYWAYTPGSLTARGTWTGMVWIVARKTNSSNDITYTMVEPVPKADGTRTYTYDQYTDPPQILSLVNQAQQYQVTLANNTALTPTLDVWYFNSLFKSHVASASVPHTLRLSVTWTGAQSGQTYGIRVVAGGRELGRRVENRIGPFFGTGTVTQSLTVTDAAVTTGEEIRLEVWGHSSGGTTRFHRVASTSLNIAWIE